VLNELRIGGLGVIDEAVLPLGPGLTVVTGETGAGKTMVVTGLLLLFGGRADSDRVRTGATQATVDGRLTVVADSVAARRVRDAGGDLDAADSSADSRELILRRVVSSAGRSRAYVGGAPAPVTVLAELAGDLLAVHGQADQVRLVRPAAQRAALDRYAGLDLAPFREAFDDWRAAVVALSDRTTRAAQLRRESDLLTYGIDEIAAVAPQPHEPAELAALAARLGGADALTAAARIAHDALVGDTDDPGSDATDASQLLANASRALAQQSGADPELDALAVRLTDLAAQSADLGAEFGSYAAALDTDPARLEQVEQRRAELATLIRKYCDDPEPSIAGVLRWAATAQARLTEIDVSDNAIAALRERCTRAEERVVALGGVISARRREAAAQLGAGVTRELAGLAMPDAELFVAVERRTSIASMPTVTVDADPAGSRDVGIGPNGFDDVHFLLTAHPGAPALPIGRGASGGELSRIMLALEVCLAGTGSAPLLVFDEVDAGVGGRAATEVGRRLARLGQDRQVLVVTHLAQVAAYADRHIVVDKPAATDDRRTGVTASDVREVAGEARVAELARMLGGADTTAAREHATELLTDRATARPTTRSRTRQAAARTGGRGRNKAAS
jgi:DNA repair protein RecN (Recombination protein N)